ncbi:MAG: hypothetical protein AB1782_03160 [Cyanobacteriota bacterium]
MNKVIKYIAFLGLYILIFTTISQQAFADSYKNACRMRDYYLEEAEKVRQKISALDLQKIRMEYDASQLEEQIEAKKQKISSIRNQFILVIYKRSSTDEFVNIAPVNLPGISGPADNYPPIISILWDPSEKKYRSITEEEAKTKTHYIFTATTVDENSENAKNAAVVIKRLKREIKRLNQQLQEINQKIAEIKQDMEYHEAERSRYLDLVDEYQKKCCKLAEEVKFIPPAPLPESNYILLTEYMSSQATTMVSNPEINNELDNTINMVSQNKQQFNDTRGVNNVNYDNGNNNYYHQQYFDTDAGYGFDAMTRAVFMSAITMPDKKNNNNSNNNDSGCNKNVSKTTSTTVNTTTINTQSTTPDTITQDPLPPPCELSPMQEIPCQTTNKIIPEMNPEHPSLFNLDLFNKI